MLSRLEKPSKTTQAPTAAAVGPARTIQLLFGGIVSVMSPALRKLPSRLWRVLSTRHQQRRMAIGGSAVLFSFLINNLDWSHAQFISWEPSQGRKSILEGKSPGPAGGALRKLPSRLRGVLPTRHQQRRMATGGSAVLFSFLINNSDWSHAQFISWEPSQGRKSILEGKSPFGCSILKTPPSPSSLSSSSMREYLLRSHRKRE